MRLRVRLVAGFVAVHLLLSVVAGVVAWRWLDATRRSHAEDSASSVGRVIAGGGFSLSPRVVERMRTLTGYEFRVLAGPEPLHLGTVQVTEGGITVEIDYRTPAWQAESRQILWGTVLLFLGGSTAFALLAATLATQFAKPVERLAESARAIGAGSWDAPVPQAGSGEVAELAHELERMRMRLTELDQAHRSAERLATLGTFTATIAHEVRNPLSAVRLTAQMLAKRYPGEAGLAVVLEEVERLDLTVDELLAFSRGMAVNPEPIDLRDVANSVVHLLRRQAEHADVELSVVDRRSDRPLVRADPQRIRQLLLNLLLNAIQAVQLGENPEPLVRVVIGDRHLVVEDNGPGVPADILPHLFEAFRSTRPAGTGLGLHLARSIAEAHGATLRHEAGSPGARFILDGLAPA